MPFKDPIKAKEYWIEFKKRPGYKEKVKEQQKKYYNKHLNEIKQRIKDKPEHYYKIRRNSLLKTKFGITLDQYNEMLVEQNGVCAICGKIDKFQALSVDHSHQSGKVRGLLCSSCNNGLGRFKDSHEILQKAIEYLHKHA